MKKRISLWLALTVLTVAMATVLTSCGSADKDGTKIDKKTGLEYCIFGVTGATGTTQEVCVIVGIGNCKNENLCIPSVINRHKIVAIDTAAFEGCTGLVSITIPDSVTRIGDFAFSGCTSLTSIQVDKGNPVYHSDGNCLIETESKTIVAGCQKSVIPTDGSVTRIGVAAFSGCAGLTSITVPDNVVKIGDFAFHNCTSLTSITIPDNVFSIGQRAFYGTDLYNDISNWEDGVLYIGKHLIEANDIASGLYEIKPGTLTISTAAFFGCVSLTGVTIPNSVTSIDDNAFASTHLTDITFSGTKSQWYKILTDTNWNSSYYWASGSNISTIHCTDGDIQI